MWGRVQLERVILLLLNDCVVLRANFDVAIPLSPLWC